MDCDASFLRAEEEEFDRLFTVLMVGTTYQHQNQPEIYSNRTRHSDRLLSQTQHRDPLSALDYSRSYSVPDTYTSDLQDQQDGHQYPDCHLRYQPLTDCGIPEGCGVAGDLDTIQFPDHYSSDKVINSSGCSRFSSDDSDDVTSEDLELFKIPLHITEDLDYLKFDHSTDSEDLSGHCCQEDGGCFVDDLDLDGILSREDDTVYYSTQDLTYRRDSFSKKRSKSFDLAEIDSYCDSEYSDNCGISKSVTMDHIGLGDTIRMNTIKLANFRKAREWTSTEGNNNGNKSSSDEVPKAEVVPSNATPSAVEPLDSGVSAHQRYLGIRGVTTTASTTEGSVDPGLRVPTAGWNRDKKPVKEPGIVDNLLGFMRRTPKRDSKTKLKRYSWSPGFTSNSFSPGPVPDSSPNQNKVSTKTKQSTRPTNLAAVTPRPPLPNISVISEVPGAMNSRLSSGDGFIFTQDVRSSRRPTGSDNPAGDKVPSKRHSCSSEIMRAARSGTLERLKKDSLRYGLKNKLWESGDKLLLDLLDDLDDISAAGPDARRRRKARDLFADWLFSDGASSTPTTPQSSSVAEQRRNSRDAFNEFLLQQGMRSNLADTDEASGLELPTHPLENLSSEEDAESGYHTGDSMLQHKARAINAIHNAAYKKQIQQTPKGKPAGGIWSPSKVTPPGGAQPIPKPPPSQRTLNRQELAGRIEAFNKNQHGLPMTMTEEKCATSADSCPCYQGFIRVYMRLMRPISMVLPAKSPNLNNVNDGSLGGHASLDRQSLEQDGGEVTSFYLPKDTTKAIHITSETTAHEVIKVLLTKFYITDNPHKFALYEKHTSSDGEVTLHRLADNDQPLVMCLGWTAEGLNNHKFVLQDNDTEEIMWDAFSTPELENFLRILTREENEYLEQVRSKYQLLRIQMNQRIKELLIEKQSMRESVQPLSDEPRDGVFV